MAHDAMPDVAASSVTSQRSDITLKQILVVTGNIEEPQATVTVVVDGRHETRQKTGKGPVDALFSAINEAIDVAGKAELTSYSVRSRGKGADAQGYVKVCLKRGDRSCIGAYQHVDILLASAHAYIEALKELGI